MERYIAYDADWQTPAKTEQHVYHSLRDSQDVVKGALYIAFPWANLIDGLARGTDLGSRLLKEYKKICAQVKNTPSFRKVTVCQHIKFKDYAYLFKGAGITDLFASHKEKLQTNLGAINLYPLQLFPVQATADVRTELAVSNQRTKWQDRPYPYSFVGAYDGRYYLTDSRKNIFEELADKGGLVTERLSWHYQARVYDQQVYGKELSEDYLTEEQKNAVEYINVLQNSKFSLCPSGTGPNSIRLWESIEYGAIPIILADTLDLPGDLRLWQDACVFIKESKDTIKTIPDVIEDILADETVYQKKIDALEQLRSTLGLANFSAHVFATVKSIVKRPTNKPKIVLDSTEISSSEEKEWLTLLNEINRLHYNRFSIYLVSNVSRLVAPEGCDGVIPEVPTEFTESFAVVFDSKTISNALLTNFDNLIVVANAGPASINSNLLPLLKSESQSKIEAWSPICTLVTSMFNGDEYKEGFLENTAKFERLEDIELLVFRPESRGSEHFDLLTFGRQNNSLIYIWLAKDPGLYDVWNLGTRLSGAKYISNANIDDKRGPKHISSLVDALEKNQECSVGSTALRVTDTKGLTWENSEESIVWYQPKSSEVYQVDKISKYNKELGVMQAHNIPHCMPVWRAKLHRQFGYFEEKRFGPSSDWEFWLRCGIQGSQFYLLNEAHGLYYRAPQSYWRRDPNAKNYDFVIANEHFSREEPRKLSLSQRVAAFELDRLIKYFAEDDFYTGMANLFEFINKKQIQFAKAEEMLLEKVCEVYLGFDLESVKDALNRLNPLMKVKDTFIETIGFCIRAIGCLNDRQFRSYFNLADKIAINESEQSSWLIKAKLYEMRSETTLESKCLSKAYNLGQYQFWCDVNRIYGLEKKLGYFIESLAGETDVPLMSDFSWVSHGKKLYFLPDYSHGNPYQKLLYQNITKAGVSAVGLSEADSIALNINIFEKGDVLHIHWINVLFRGHTNETISVALDEFLDKVEQLKSNGVKIIWTVHNRQNHETVDLDVELAFRRKLSGLCDAVLLHHPMIAMELSHWLAPNCKIEIVEHGLYSNYYLNSISKKDARAQLGLDDNATVVSTLGQVREYKDLPQKIDTISSVKQSSSVNLDYVIAGRISCEKTLASLKKRDVAVVENRFIKDEEVQIFLNCCDFVLLSYRDILTSGSFFQAVTFDKPVLSPQLGSLNYYICDGVNGFKYDAATLEGILSEISQTEENECPFSHEALLKIDWPNFITKTEA